jgi:hypothetical protein
MRAQAGRIIEQGSHEELMRNPTGAYAQLVHVREHEPVKAAEDEAGAAKGVAKGPRKSMYTGKAATGARKSVMAGGARKSMAGGARKSVAGGARKSVAAEGALSGARKSVAGGPRMSAIGNAQMGVDLEAQRRAPRASAIGSVAARVRASVFGT